MSRLRRLLVPHDLSAHADAALREAAELAGPDGALRVLHVVVPMVSVVEFGPGAGFDLPIDDVVAGARQRLERAARRAIGRRGPTVEIAVEVGDPYGRIVANARGMDAIVMSTLGRTGLAHLVVGSVAEKVVRHSPVPVLTLRPAATRRGSRGVTRRRGGRR